MQVMTVAVAAGVTSTFGAPFAGILFSAELCSTVFLLSNFWKLFVCGTIVKFWYEMGLKFKVGSGLSSMYIDQSVIINNIQHYITIGVICGWLGSTWIYFFSLFLQYKSQRTSFFFKKWVFIFFATFSFSQFLIDNQPLCVHFDGFECNRTTKLWPNDRLCGKQRTSFDFMVTWLSGQSPWELRAQNFQDWFSLGQSFPHVYRQVHLYHVIFNLPLSKWCIFPFHHPRRTGW